ncbi:MAG TPA: hypothetical protein VNO24_03540, partial [Blastocatellia bacterium]|nr:hypothetical protein [Blastocatellia bacterium]
MRNKVRIELLLLVCVALIMPMSATSGAKGRNEVFSALAQLPVEGRTTNVKIYINGYSTTQDAERLHAALVDGGSKALLKVLSKMKSMGRIEREGTVGNYDFKLILSKPTATGRHIYAVADRPIGFLEEYFSTRSKDFPFGILELDLKEDNEKEKGEGTLIYAAKVRVVSGDKVEIENLSFAPIRLLG